MCGQTLCQNYSRQEFYQRSLARRWKARGWGPGLRGTGYGIRGTGYGVPGFGKQGMTGSGGRHAVLWKTRGLTEWKTRDLSFFWHNMNFPHNNEKSKFC